ncbi:CYTH domain-containing protein [Gaoshiqia sp. Z1-71]|uniref:CYTH domain-containing protein n=1 Tax=Gaoshiqia hydrogeniformans TaxID=3290090 RepID=UPI003BF8C1F5
MPVEIERKFLVHKEQLPVFVRSIPMLQAYLCIDPQRTIRVRIADNQAFLTIKGRMKGISRPEFEYPVPLDEAKELLALAVGYPVEKVRNEVYEHGKKWEVDVFEGLNSGLILAEIELESPDEEIVFPEWVAEEVSADMRFYNSQLSLNPFTRW